MGKNLQEFLTRLNEDKDFETKFKALNNIYAVLSMASKEGYCITADDVETLRHETAAKKTGCKELPDEVMDEVTGGVFFGLANLGQPKWFKDLLYIYDPDEENKYKNLNFDKLDSPVQYC